MSALANRTPKDTVGDLLHVENGGAGADSVLRRVESGSGAATAISLSTDKARVDGDLEVTGKVVAAQVAGAVATIGIVVDGGGIEIGAGDKADVEVPYDCVVLKASAYADAAGSVQFDVLRSTAAAYPPSASGSICGATKPALANAASWADAVLTGWATTLAAGDVLRFTTGAATGIKRLTVNLRVRKA